MNEMAISLAGSAGLAVVTAWVGFAFGTRQRRDEEQRHRRIAAATDLVAPLRELQRLVRAHGRETVDTHDAAAAFLAWSAAWDSHRHRLPASWRHLARSVRDAAGTVFGGIALVHLRPEAKELELGQPDAMWQDYADDYLDYATDLVLQWGDSNTDAPRSLNTYGDWLVRTGRREPYGSNRQPTTTPGLHT